MKLEVGNFGKHFHCWPDLSKQMTKLIIARKTESCVVLFALTWTRRIGKKKCSVHDSPLLNTTSPVKENTAGNPFLVAYDGWNSKGSLYGRGGVSVIE